MTKQEQYVLRQAELNAAYRKRNTLRSIPDADIDEVVAVDARIARLESAVALLNIAAQKEAENERARARMMADAPTIETWRAKLKGVMDQRKLLDADRKVAEAEKCIRDVTKQDAELAKQQAFFRAKIFEMKQASVV